MKAIVHSIMLLFGGVSIQNIAIYFVSAGHSASAAWTLGIALGMALIVVSIMLTHLDYGQDVAAFWWLLITGGVLALISGSIQAAEYAKHLDLWTARGLGYTLPLGGEILLALGTAHYTSAKRQQKIRMATAGTAERIAECVAEALSDVDVSRIRGYVERRIDAIVRAQVDVVAQQLMPAGDVPKANAESHAHPQFGPQNLPQAQTKRAQQVVRQDAERKQAILAYLTQHQTAGTSAIAEHLGVHRDTARKTCQELAEAGALVVDKRKWKLKKAEEGGETAASAP